MNSRSFRGCHLWLPGLSQTLWGDWEDSWPRLGYFTFRKWTVGKKRTRIRREWWIFHLFCGVCLYGILKEEVLVDQTGGILRFGPVSFSKVLITKCSMSINMGIQETYLDAIKNRRLVWRRYIPSSSTQSVSFKSNDDKKATKLPTASDCVNHTRSIYWNGFAVLQFQDFWLTVIFHETAFLTNLASANSWELASETWKLTTRPLGCTTPTQPEASFNGLLEACRFGYGHFRPISNFQKIVSVRCCRAKWREKTGEWRYDMTWCWKT